jgi:DNA-binding response OmpR family regulator
MLQSEGNLLVIGREELSFLLKHILEADGHKAAVFPSIEGALYSVRRDAFDLIILDDSLLAAPGNHAFCRCDLVRQWTAPLLILGGRSIRAPPCRSSVAGPDDRCDTQAGLARRIVAARARRAVGGAG